MFHPAATPIQPMVCSRIGSNSTIQTQMPLTSQVTSSPTTLKMSLNGKFHSTRLLSQKVSYSFGPITRPFKMAQVHCTPVSNSITMEKPFLCFHPIEHFNRKLLTTGKRQ